MQTFSRESYQAWELFCRVAKKGRDPKTKLDYYEFDWGAIAVLFPSYGITDVRVGLSVMEFIRDTLTGEPVQDDVVLGIESNDEEGSDG